MLNKYFILVWVTLCAHWHLYAQQVPTTQGTEFWLGFMKNYDQDAGEELRILISSDHNTNGVVLVSGQGYAQPFTVLANSTTTVVVPNMIGEMTNVNLVENRGIHVVAQDSVSVVAYNFNPYTGDAARILPLEALGTAYIASSYTGLPGYESELLVLATADDTQIEITPSTGLVGGYTAGVPFTLDLQAGECIQLRALVNGDVTGTLIKGSASNGLCRPFAVFSGTDCANITADCGLCDHLFEQNYSVPMWGESYYLPPWVFTSPAAYTWRVLAAQDNTTITVDGSDNFSLNAGQFIEFNQDDLAHCIAGDAPIAVVQYMESMGCAGFGDPSMLLINDASKQLNHISFSTLSSPVITDHYLNLVIEANYLGQVLLDGVQINPNLFQQFNACSNYMWCGLEINPGNHVLSMALGGMTGYIYGVGEGESYAYGLGSLSPEVPAAPEEAICSAASVTLEMDPLLIDASWSLEDDPSSILYNGNTWTLNSPFVPGNYLGLGYDPLSGCPVTTLISVESPEIPDYSMVSDQSICRFESVQLWIESEDAFASYNYQWSPTMGLNDATIANPIATPQTNTTYTCTMTTLSGCAWVVDSVTIEVSFGTISSMQIEASDTTLCEGDSAHLEVITEGVIWEDDFDPSVAWGSWEDVTNGSANSLCGSVSDQALYFNGLTTREAISIPLDVSEGGHIDFYLKIGSGSAPCDNAEVGDNVVLSYSVNNGPWVNIQTFYESNYPDFTALSLEIPVGAYSNNTRFKWSQIGLWLNNQDNWALDNVQISSVQTSEYSYTWSPQTNLTTISSGEVAVNPAVTSMYYVTLLDNNSGCSYIDSVEVQVDSPITIELDETAALCDNGGIQLLAETNTDEILTFVWSPITNINNPYLQQPTVTPDTNTIYSVEAISAGGCIANAEINIAVALLEDLLVTVDDAAICPGESVNLNASFSSDLAGLNYQWNPAATVNQPQALSTLASPLTTTSYAFEVSYLDLCTWEGQTEVTVVPTFSISANLDSLIGCSLTGNAVEATANTADPLNWTWSPANLVANPNQAATAIIANATGNLIVQAENAAGCTSQDTIALEFLTYNIEWPPLIEACQDTLIALDTELPDTYIFDWNVNYNGASLSIADPGFYEVTATSPEGCISYASTDVVLYAFPPKPNFSDTSFCEGALVTLDAYVGNFHYQWQDGSELSFYNVSSTGIYEVTIDNGFCFTTTSAEVNVYAGPEAPFSEEGIEVCLDYPPFQLLLNAENEGMTFLWNTGSTNQVVEATASGLYEVLVTSEQGCSASYSIELINTCEGALFVPNSFTPDQDGINDYWYVSGDRIYQFEIFIYDRWGEVFYQSNDAHFKWIGQRRDGSHFVEPGVYPYLIKVKFLEPNGLIGEEQLINGFVTVVR